MFYDVYNLEIGMQGDIIINNNFIVLLLVYKAIILPVSQLDIVL